MKRENHCTLTNVGLPVPMALVSLLCGRVLALLTLGYRGPRVVAATWVAATSRLVAQHYRYSTCEGSYPPLTGLLLRCASVRSRFLGAAAFAAFVLIRLVYCVDVLHPC